MNKETPTSRQTHGGSNSINSNGVGFHATYLNTFQEVKTDLEGIYMAQIGR